MYLVKRLYSTNLKLFFVLSRDKQSIPSKIKNEVRMPTLPLLLNIALGNLVDAMRAYDSIRNCSSVACHETNTDPLAFYSSRVLHGPYTFYTWFEGNWDNLIHIMQFKNCNNPVYKPCHTFTQAVNVSKFFSIHGLG